MPIKIKSDELAIIANKLDRMHKSDLPIAVRSTLNEMAFRMKKKEIADSAKREFDYKRTNIVQNLTRFEKAKGFDIARMKSKAGITEQPRRQKVARGLAAQEKGGKLQGKSTPTLKARGGSASSKVRKANRMQSNRMVDARNARRQNFIAAAAIAKKNNQFLLVSTNSGSVDAVARVSRFTRKKRGNPNIKLRWMYSIHHNDKSISPSNTRKFMKKAYIRTMNDFHAEFIRQANKRLKK